MDERTRIMHRREQELEVRERSVERRERKVNEAERSVDQRDRTADERDATADKREGEANDRERDADECEQAAANDQGDNQDQVGDQIVLPAGSDQRERTGERGARAQAEIDRAWARSLRDPPIGSPPKTRSTT